MEIESADPKTQSPTATPKTLAQQAAELTEQLRGAADQRNPSDLLAITARVKKLNASLTLREVTALLSQKNSIVADGLLKWLNAPGAVPPSANNEDQTVDVLLVALALVKEARHEASIPLMEGLLFGTPTDLASRAPLVSLTAILLSKLFLSIEKAGRFQMLKPKIYEWLTLFRGGNFELPFAVVYVGLLRNLMKENQLREVAQLLKNCQFPEHIGHSQLAKYLFYKALYLSQVGKISQAANFATESLRKAPEGRGRKGLNGFKLRVRKLKLVLQLIMNEPPTHEWLSHSKIPHHYMGLVHAVNLGNHDEFGRLTTQHAEKFARDGMVSLLEKMRSVVMRNALKKLSVAYSRISLEDVLKKIGAVRDQNFDLNAFLTKSRADLPDFRIDHKNSFIEFTRSLDDYAASHTRENLIKRVRHLQGLEGQVAKSLRYRVPNKEQPKENEEDESAEDDYHFSDYSVNDMDI
jgi:26S proteasome regulatory subunit N3